RFELDTGWGGSAWSEHVRIEDADVLARYSGGPLDGLPAVTSRTITNGGRALYVSGAIDQESIDGFVATPLGPESLAELPAGVEMAVRETAAARLTFFIN
ncbi:beta-galactosidase, partial [Lacisediminihabitans profunda]